MPISPMILSHIQTETGLRTLAVKWEKELQRNGFFPCGLLDTLELLGDLFEPLANLNIDLANSKEELMEEIALAEAKTIRKKIQSYGATHFIVLSWSCVVAALWGIGLKNLGKKCIVKLDVHHQDQIIESKLYERADLLVTESLLANERAIHYGFRPGKILFLPHPCIIKEKSSNRAYVTKLAEIQKKKIDKDAVVIGVVSRLEPGKNCEFALDAVRQIVKRGHKITFVLKGRFTKKTQYPEYQKKLYQFIESFLGEPWFLWDSTQTAFPDVLEDYCSFDLLLHPSGAEAGSNVIIEHLGLGKPVLALEGSTNPYLFKGCVQFVKNTGKLYPAQLPFFIPDMEDLYSKLEEMVSDAKLRKFWGQQGLEGAKKRFASETLRNRFSLLFHPDANLIAKLYEEDRRLYGL